MALQLVATYDIVRGASDKPVDFSDIGFAMLDCFKLLNTSVDALVALSLMWIDSELASGRWYLVI